MRIHARHYATGQSIELAIAAGRIASVTEPSGTPDLTADWVAPSFFDIQVNGCLGISFNSDKLTADDVRRVAEVCRRHGVGGFCPTLITASTEALTHGFATLARLCDDDADLARTIPTFHLEGPYIAGEDGPCGAHPKAHVRPPDWDEFRRWQDAARGRIRIVTLAPELPGRSTSSKSWPQAASLSLSATLR